MNRNGIMVQNWLLAGISDSCEDVCEDTNWAKNLLLIEKFLISLYFLGISTVAKRSSQLFMAVHDV